MTQIAHGIHCPHLVVVICLLWPGWSLDLGESGGVEAPLVENPHCSPRGDSGAHIFVEIARRTVLGIFTHPCFSISLFSLCDRWVKLITQLSVSQGTCPLPAPSMLSTNLVCVCACHHTAIFVSGALLLVIHAMLGE